MRASGIRDSLRFMNISPTGFGLVPYP
jgi:hypothetical protein